MSVGLYEGQSVLMYSSGSFAGIGSKIIVPERNQQCSVWSSEYLGLRSSVIESRIDGDFDGWDGDTLFKLTNGQVWQQASYGYYYAYTYGPRVYIFLTPSGYKMAVERSKKTIGVTRLK